MDDDNPGHASGQQQQPAGAEDTPTPPKRSRVLLSCAPCRVSKLKCDRAVPCTNCLKKSRADLCKYAPRPVKERPPKSMAARLKRLEGMVREMLVEDGGGGGGGGGSGSGSGGGSVREPSSDLTAAGEGEDDSGGRVAAATAAASSSASGGQVIRAAGARGGSTIYVGATHFMAMLGDIEDLKSYFDHEDTSPEVDGDSPEAFTDEDSPAMLIGDRSAPRSRQDLLDLLPPKHIADRLVMRYFAAHSASQHVIHRPVFSKFVCYNEFWANPTSPNVDMDFIALLYMILALGVFFSNFMAPHELASDNVPLTPMQRFRRYRAAAGAALTYSTRDGQYGITAPGPLTCAPLVLYVEAEFLINRTSQMNCYLLSGVCIRIMLKMGLHRDATKLPGSPLSPFEAEMARRMWTQAIQIDLMVSFHLGLPSMIHGIESDTLPPRNLRDEDFDENVKELPPARPGTEYTNMTYPTYKAGICNLFGLVARQTHALTEPTYDEVMDLDNQLAAKFDAMPDLMKVKPLDECVTEPPSLVVQRFGLAALYHKAICVLHRRYLVAKTSRREHDYSRRRCLLAGLALLEYQNTVFEAAKPGGMLSQDGWFVSSLAMHDLLLAAMVIYLVIQNDHYSEPGGDFDWTRKDTVLPSKTQLMEALKRSYRIWTEVAIAAPEVKKAPEVLAVMFRKIERSRAAKGESVSMLEEIQVQRPQGSGPTYYYPSLDSLRIDGKQQLVGQYGTKPRSPANVASPKTDHSRPASSVPDQGAFNMSSGPQPQLSGHGFASGPVAADPSMEATWVPEATDAMETIDWSTLERAIRANATFGSASGTDQWMGDDNSFDYSAINFTDYDFTTGRYHQGS